VETLERVRAKIKANMPLHVEPQLQWKKLSDWCLQSHCKRFTVGKGHDPKDGSSVYECWYFKTPLAFRLKSSQEAKDLCESHALNLNRPPVENTIPAVLPKKSKAEQVGQ
jgi:hypothetical protein